MADYDIFREQMGIMFPKYGHALWDPGPWKPDSPVKVGDVGFIRMGKFHCLFNALYPKDEQANVPEGYEPLVPKSSPHITQRSLNSGHYCSVGVGVNVEQDMHLANPDDPREVSVKCSGRRGALLSLPVNARREDTLAQNAFGEWIVKHINQWLAFAQELQLGVEHMEDIILVTGCDRTRSWTNIAFLEGRVDAKGSFREKVVEHADGSVEVQYSSGHVAGGVLSHGSQGKNLPDDQCVFIRGFRVARTFKIFPKRLKAAAGPSPDPGGYDCEPDMELISIPATTKHRDPLHVLLDYIAERACDCDLVLVHDDDLERIDGISEGSSLESLESEVVMDLLRGSDIEIQKVCCDLSSASSSPNSDIGIIWVAMLSMLSKDWNSVVPSQPLPPAVHFGPSPCRASELPVPSPPSVSDHSPVPSIPGGADLCDSVPLSRFGNVSEINLPALDKIGHLLPGIWSSLSMLAHVGRQKLVATIAVAFFAGALFGLMFSFNWLDISKHWFTILLASFALCLWFERKHTHRRFNEMHERMEALQHQIMSLQSNPTVTAFVADTRSTLPIMAKTTPAYREMMDQSTQFTVQPPTAGAEIRYAHQTMTATPQESTRNKAESESSIVNLGGGASEQHIEHPGSNTVSGSTHVAEPSHPDGCSNADSSAPSAAGDLSQFGKINMGAPISRTPAPHIPADVPIKLSEQESDTSLPPSPEYPRKRPGPLNLQTTINTNVTPPLPSLLATARYIEDITRITYPEGINRPKLELNVNTQKGKFRYDRDFLLQFMNICKEKPDNLPPLDVIGLEPSDTSHTISRSGSDRRNSLSMPSITRPPSIGLGFLPGSMGKATGSGFQMGPVSTSASKMSSEERFLAASAGRSVSVTGGPLGSRPPAMDRTISGTSPTAHIFTMGPPMELVAPLEISANRWVATSTRRDDSSVDGDSPEMVERKVKALLNKLTMKRFDSISDQIIAWANKSEREKDGRTLIQVIKLIFEKATDEATFSAMYARLCRKMMDKISPKVQDDSIKNAEGRPLVGGQLFRKYLLNRCQEDFERGCVAASKATEDRAVKEANKKTKGEESELYSDEYYAAAKAKRCGLGLIRLIGELFKRQMLTERIIHECIKKFLGNVVNPEEEQIESLCKLLTTVGSLLDTRKARAHLNVYFLRMRELTKNKNVNARMMFMLQDVIELRERRWVPRKVVAGPMTIAQVHAEAAKESRLAQEKDPHVRQDANMSHGGSRGDGNYDAAEPFHPDGSSVAGSGTPTYHPLKAGDLSQFGKISKATPISFGPGSILTSKKATDPKNRDPPMSHTPSTSSLAPPAMSEAESKAKIQEDTKEFFSIRILEEAESYFSSLPPEHRHWLVDSLVINAIEMKERDVVLVSELFVRVREKELCSPAIFEEGFKGLAEVLDDLAVDIPKAWPYFVILLRGSGLDRDEERRGRIAEKTMDPDKLNRLL